MLLLEISECWHIMLVVKENSSGGFKMFDKEEIREYGLQYSLVKVNTKDLNRKGYQKLNADMMARAFAIFRYVPSNVALEAQKKMADKNAEEMAKDAFKVILKDGMHLAKSKSTMGAYRGAELDDITNKVAGQAEWMELNPIKLSRTPQIVAGVFSAMSMVTSQYYLAEISKKMESIDNKIDSIKEILLNDKRAKVWTDNQVLDQIYSNLKYTMDNHFERQVVLTEVITIKREALSNISFFDMQIHSKLDHVNPKGKKDEIEDTIKEIFEYMPEYWNSLWAYEKAVLLEVVIAEMDAPEYLSNNINAISGYKSMYFKTLEECRKRINILIDSSSSLNIDLWTGVLFLATGAAVILIPGNKKYAVAGGAAVALTVRESFKANSKSELKEKVNRYLEYCNNIELLDEVSALLLEYKKIRNCPIEFIKCGDDIYFKLLETTEKKRTVEAKKKKIMIVSGR